MSGAGALCSVMHEGAGLGQFSPSQRQCSPDLRLPVLAHENLSWDCLRLLVDHWYFSSTILALPAAAIPSLKSDTSAILPALSMWSLTKQAKTNVPRVLMFVLFSPSHCHYIRAPLFSCRDCRGILPGLPAPRLASLSCSPPCS